MAYRILIPVDFSRDSEPVYDLLARLGSQQPVEATFFHVIQTPVLPASMNPAMDFYTEMVAELKAQTQKELEALARDTRFAQVHIQTHYRTDTEGPVSLQVAEYAAAEGFDLVLTVSKHLTGIERLLLGTELLSLLRLCRVPVLCLSAAQPPSFRRMLFASDFSPETASIFPGLLRLSGLLQAQLEVARINTPSDFLSQRQFQQAEQALRARLEAQSLALAGALHQPRLYNDADVVDGILHCAEDLQADVVVLATHARRGFSRLVTGSITEAVLEETQLPVLVFRLGE